jgi:hypothetical protein
MVRITTLVAVLPVAYFAVVTTLFLDGQSTPRTVGLDSVLLMGLQVTLMYVFVQWPDRRRVTLGFCVFVVQPTPRSCCF